MPVLLKITAGIITLLLALAMALTWNEARKEVKFLCGNFSAGVSKASVIAQLETGHFLRYRQQATGPGALLTADSAYTLGWFQCRITLDADGTVLKAYYGAVE